MTALVEATLVCQPGSVYESADVGNYFDRWFAGRLDERSPEKVYSMNVEHWSWADRFKAALAIHRGAGQAYLKVIHYDVDEETRQCSLCENVVGTPVDVPEHPRSNFAVEV